MADSKTARLERELERARQELADLQAVEEATAATLARLEREAAESLESVPLDDLDTRARARAEAAVDVEAQRLKLSEVERRVASARVAMERAQGAVLRAVSLQRAKEVYAQADETAAQLRALLPSLRAGLGEEADQIRRGCADYQPVWPRGLVDRLESALEVFEKEAPERGRLLAREL